MSYEPNAQDAIGVYIIAAADVYGVPLYAVDTPGYESVQETSPGKFRIHNSKERDDNGRFNPDMAVCTYDEGRELWRVKLSTGEMVQVRDVGEGFAVVAD